MEHDDGQLPLDIEEADVILVGISRTSKTPTSIYLANRGVKATNVPIVLGIPVPEVLFTAKRPLIVGLVATAERISQIRQNRPLGSVPSLDTGLYTDRVSISEELAFARNICNRHGWPTIEETAAAILALLRTGKNEGFQS
jgi:regulator of PEP synthase PpsR (kinase-PPPase family)